MTNPDSISSTLAVPTISYVDLREKAENDCDEDAEFSRNQKVQTVLERFKPYLPNDEFTLQIEKYQRQSFEQEQVSRNKLMSSKRQYSFRATKVLTGLDSTRASAIDGEASSNSLSSMTTDAQSNRQYVHYQGLPKDLVYAIAAYKVRESSVELATGCFSPTYHLLRQLQLIRPHRHELDRESAISETRSSTAQAETDEIVSDGAIEILVNNEEIADSEARRSSSTETSDTAIEDGTEIVVNGNSEEFVRPEDDCVAEDTVSVNMNAPSIADDSSSRWSEIPMDNIRILYAQRTAL